MSVLICKVDGTRGRRIAVYDNKCVITTDVSLGSIMTSNALDGQKTIFYLDIKGIQFKKCGLTLGYLQLETSSIQMNNQSSNMFSENTFTYNDVVNGVSNEMMEMIHDYIVDRTESYKYGIPAQRKCLYDLVALAEKTPGCYVEHEILKQVQKEINEQRQIEEQELLQKQRIEQEIQRRQIEEFRRTVQDTDGGAQILLFIEKASTYTRTMEIQKLWKSFDWDKSTVATLIEEKINEAAQIERMYGSSPSSITSLLDGIKKLI